jgi:hypothetical protein
MNGQSTTRRRSIASRVRLLMVPSGSPSSRAISAWVAPVVGQLDRPALPDREVLERPGHRAPKGDRVRRIRLGGFTGEPHERFPLSQPGLMRTTPQEVDRAIGGQSPSAL